MMNCQEKEEILKYEGEFSFGLIEKFVASIKKTLDEKGTETSIKKKIINIMVECLENIHKHADPLHRFQHINENYKMSFLVQRCDNTYEIIATNPVDNEIIPILKEKINFVNSTDKEGLKKKYEEIILQGQISPKNGAGLGLIDIALKSGQKIDCEFTPIDNEHSLYKIIINVAKKKPIES